MTQVIIPTEHGRVILCGLMTIEQCEKAVKEGRMIKVRPRVYQYK